MPFADVHIQVVDSAHVGFVTENDVHRALHNITANPRGLSRAAVNTLDMEQTLRNLDKVEDAQVLELNNGTLLVRVTPMRPVARVFDGKDNYYINASGKRIAADAVHHVDVPLVSGHFADPAAVTALLPMFDYIHSHPEYDALVTAVTVNNAGDIVIIPAVAGHVVIFGDTSAVADKLGRLKQFYHKVMPVKGWQYYDTLSVKWRGQIVATQRHKKAARTDQTVQPDPDMAPDAETMDAGLNLTDSVLSRRWGG